MGKLTKILQGARQSGPSIGFATRRTEWQPRLPVVAVLPEANEELARAVVEGGADAVAVAGLADTEAAKAVLQRLAPVLEGRPLGVVTDGAVEASSGTDLQAAGVDFVALSPETPAGLMNGEFDKVIRLPINLEPTEVRSLDLLDVNVFIATRGAEAGKGKLKVSEAARVRLLTSITNKFVLVSVADDGLLQDLELLARIGVEGLVLEPSYLTAKPGTARAKVESFKDAVSRLAPLRRTLRRGEEVPLLPRVSSSPPSVEEEEEEPELP